MGLREIIRNAPKPPRLSSSSNTGTADIIYPTVDYSAEIAECRRQIQLCDDIIIKNRKIIDEYTIFSREIFNCKKENNSLMSNIKDAENDLHEGYNSGGEFLDKNVLRECYMKLSSVVSYDFERTQNLIEEKIHECYDKINKANSSKIEWQNKLNWYLSQ